MEIPDEPTGAAREMEWVLTQGMLKEGAKKTNTWDGDTQSPQRRERAETETKRVEEFNESLVPLNCTAGAWAHEDQRACGSECVCVCVCVCIHLWNTGLCIIYQTAVSFVLLFTLQARSRANREPSQREWQPPKQFNWRLKQLIMPLLSLQCNYLNIRGC